MAMAHSEPPRTKGSGGNGTRAKKAESVWTMSIFGIFWVPYRRYPAFCWEGNPREVMKEDEAGEVDGAEEPGELVGGGEGEGVPAGAAEGEGGLVRWDGDKPRGGWAGDFRTAGSTMWMVWNRSACDSVEISDSTCVWGQT